MHLEQELEKKIKKWNIVPYTGLVTGSPKQGLSYSRRLLITGRYQLHSPINSGYFSSFRREA
jgi:hypothetical protein